MDNYQENDYNYDYQQPDNTGGNKSLMGMKIVIVILLVVLAAVSVLYFMSVQRSRADEAALRESMDTLQVQTQRLMGDMDNLKFDNDTLNRNLSYERHKADSLINRLKSERQASYAKLRQYERELGTLRTTMRGFVRQIDSLNRLNQKLVGENLNYKKEITGLRLKTEAAVETAQELNQKVARGSQIKARNILLKAVQKNGKDATRARQAVRLEVELVLTSNELANHGDRMIYVRIISPEGYNLQESQGQVFDFEGQNTPFSASRSVDYRGDDLPVSVFYNGTGFNAGKYTVYVYMDGLMIGTNEIILK
ncbi:hypothetical protein BN938_2392 [Mucinivorans hirudinis]|uniref:Uncharacterized protein n=1 Tax=Mucinivorans hirudinis TaxID=1433126 RepID=A0A060RDS7_9BACT|nr:hypothetical protein BN938_2392 [Mucinivorans hirudinis]